MTSIPTPFICGVPPRDEITFISVYNKEMQKNNVKTVKYILNVHIVIIFVFKSHVCDQKIKMP